MKILNDENMNEVKCEHCGVRLLFDERDITTGAFGLAYIKCPKCGNIIYIEDERFDKKINLDNITFPNDFWHSENAYDMSDKDIQDSVNRCAKGLKEGMNFYDASCGNTHVFGYRLDGEYTIIVAKNVWEVEI